MGTPTALRKTRAVLTGTSFADNTTGAITAQMIRQYVESDMGGYGCINHASADGTPVAQAIANGTTVTIDWSLGSSGSDVAQDTGTVSSTTVGADADFANDVGSFNMSGIIDATGHTTYTDVYARIKHNNGSSQNMLLQYGQLSAVRIG